MVSSSPQSSCSLWPEFFLYPYLSERYGVKYHISHKTEENQEQGLGNGKKNINYSGGIVHLVIFL